MKKGAILAVVLAGAMAVGLTAGCNKRDEEHSGHYWTYISDGESGHHRQTTCSEHEPISESVVPHEYSGDNDTTCNKCDYVRTIEGGGSEVVRVTGVSISGSASVQAGKTIELKADVTPAAATNKTVVWSITEGAQYAEIDGATGMLTGKAAGRVKVQATADGVSAMKEIEVTAAPAEDTTVHVTGVTLSQTSVELTVGGSDVKLTPTIAPADADDKCVIWSSDNHSAATVADGVIHAVGEGTAIITVTTVDGGFKATCAVTVEAAGGNQGGETGKDPSKPSEPIETPDEPVIPKPAAGAPAITKASLGELESAYIEWTAADGADWYDVYYKTTDGDAWTKIDSPLVRQYKDYYRADVVGLKAGSYDMKVVPVGGDGNAAEQYSSVAEKITVYSHDRAGFAFVGGTSSGAYNEDGTLKAGANVIYVTDETKDTVELNGNAGLQNILNAQRKEAAPLSVRIIGNISSPEIDGKNNKNPNTVLVKEITSGITFEGIGNDATANGWTLRLVSNTNAEVRNIGFMNTKASEPDNITLEKNNHVWIHNCDLFYGGAGGDSDQAKGDGALDTKESTYVTHSYNHFWDSGKCNLQNMKETGDFKITYHHNWYDHSDSRHPRIRTATVHVYNNYFDGNAKYGVGVTMGASAFVENNYFRSTTTMRPMMSSEQGTDALGEGTFSSETGGIIKSFGNFYDCAAGDLKLITQKNAATVNEIDCYEASSRNEKVPSSVKTIKGGTAYNNFDTADDMYTYAVDTAEQAKIKVERYAGRVDGGDFKWEFDDSKEDGNYSIITALKTALTQYKGTVLKVGDVEIKGGSTGGEGGGETPDTPPATVEGEISFIPTKSGNGFTVEGTTKSNAAMTVGGVNIPKSGALKLNSSGKVTFTTTETMTLTLYVEKQDKGVKIDGVLKSGSQLTAESSYFVVSVTIEAGEHVITQGSGESTLYLIKLAPVS